MAENTLPLFADAGKFYVYVYRDPRPKKKHAPIYVGKGTASHGRADVHWARGTHNPILKKIFAKIRADGLAPSIEVVGWFDDENSAFSLERALIAKFGRRDRRSGTLANLTDGGDGVSGLSTESLAKKRASHKAMWDDPAYRECLIKHINKRWADPEFKARMSGISSEWQNTERAKFERSEKSKKMWNDPDFRKAMSEKHKSRLADEENRSKFTEAFNTEEYRKRRSEIAKSLWADPVKRENMLKNRRQRTAQ